MTENEAINELQANIDLPFGFTVSDETTEFAIKALEEIQQYRAIGTVEEFKVLKEKKRTKKPKSNKIIFTGDSHAYCPYCKAEINVFFTGKCGNCDKEIEW